MVVFCGVRFMAEGCYTLAPETPVYLPSARALCSLAEVDADEVRERQEFLRELGRNFVTMTYVNTYADVKALSDACCTSSNAARIAERLGAPDILFVPDQNLAYQVAIKTRRMYLPPPEPHQFHPKEYLERDRAADARGRAAGAGGQRVRVGGRVPRPPPDDRRRHRAHPRATIPTRWSSSTARSSPSCRRAADEVLSTSQMVKYVEAHPEKTRLAILTECGLVVRLELEHPEKQFYKPCRLCQYMKANDLENVYETLRDEPPQKPVTVPEDVRAGAARAMLRDDRARARVTRRRTRRARPLRGNRRTRVRPSWRTSGRTGGCAHSSWSTPSSSRSRH